MLYTDNCHCYFRKWRFGTDIVLNMATLNAIFEGGCDEKSIFVSYVVVGDHDRIGFCNPNSLVG